MSWLEDTRAKMAANRAKMRANRAKRKAKWAAFREKNAAGGVNTKKTPPLMDLDKVNKNPYSNPVKGVQDVPSHLMINAKSRNVASRLSPFERNAGIDSASFDVTSPSEVKKVQKMLGVKTDGVFGPKTEAAWRDYVNRARGDEGKEGYFWDEVTKNSEGLDEVAEAANSEYSSVLGEEGYGAPKETLYPDTIKPFLQEKEY